MGKSTNIEDVAHLAGVSMKTVSRVINREPNVRDSTRVAVEEAIAKLGYRPNASARNLASQNARLIVLIYDDPSYYELPSSGYIINLQEGALRACRPANHELLIHPCNLRDERLAAELISSIRQLRPAGVIIAPPLSNMREIVGAVQSTEVPFVQLSPGDAGSAGFAVRTNDRDICADMVDYLASLGHRRIAFIRGDRGHSAVDERYRGYRDGLVRNDLPLEDALVSQGDSSMGSGEACARALLGSETPPTAIFAANDDMAVGVMRAARQLKIAVPEALSVAGCDDIVLAQQVYPTLTTIHQPLVEMARHATQILLEAGRGEEEAIAEPETLPGAIVRRESTGPAPR